jgi:hypothetical protein
MKRMWGGRRVRVDAVAASAAAEVDGDVVAEADNANAIITEMTMTRSDPITYNNRRKKDANPGNDKSSPKLLWCYRYNTATTPAFLSSRPLLVRCEDGAADPNTK